MAFPKQKVEYRAVHTVVFACGGALGSIGSGYMKEALGWRLVLVPLAIFVTFSGILVMITMRRKLYDPKVRWPGIDWYGGVWLFLSLASLSFALNSLAEDTSSDSLFKVVIPFVTFVVFIILFGWLEQRRSKARGPSKDAIIKPGIFYKHYRLWPAYIATIFANMASEIPTFFMPLFLQLLDLSSSRIGLFLAIPYLFKLSGALSSGFGTRYFENKMHDSRDRIAVLERKPTILTSRRAPNLEEMPESIESKIEIEELTIRQNMRRMVFIGLCFVIIQWAFVSALITIKVPGKAIQAVFLLAPEIFGYTGLFIFLLARIDQAAELEDVAESEDASESEAVAKEKLRDMAVSINYAFDDIGANLGLAAGSIVFRRCLQGQLERKRGHDTGTLDQIKKILDSVEKLKNPPAGWEDDVNASFTAALRWTMGVAAIFMLPAFASVVVMLGLKFWKSKCLGEIIRLEQNLVADRSLTEAIATALPSSGGSSLRSARRSSRTHLTQIFLASHGLILTLPVERCIRFTTSRIRDDSAASEQCSVCHSKRPTLRECSTSRD